MKVKCSYCETENEQVENCIFCDAPLNKARPVKKEFVYLDQCEWSFHQLAAFHVFDLLLLLRFVREERTKCYQIMRGVQKLSDNIEVEKDSIEFAEKQYRHYTKRMRVIEGILIDRMGYKPKRVDDKLLGALEMKIKEVK